MSRLPEDKAIEILKGYGYVIRQPRLIVKSGYSGKEFNFLVTGDELNITLVEIYSDDDGEFAVFYDKDGEVHKRNIWGHGSTPLNAWRDAVLEFEM